MPVNTRSLVSVSVSPTRNTPWARNPDDVAGPGFIDDLAFLGEEQDRVVHADAFAGAGLLQAHAATELAGAQAQERDTVAMVRVHVGLHLENETCHFIFRRHDTARIGCLRPRRRGETPKRLQQIAYAEILQRGAEENRRHVATAINVEIEG
jgi:hypothetical protein